MLVLTRYVDESILLDGCIRVVVHEISNTRHGLRVKLGLMAPDDVNIVRGELDPRLEQEIIERTGNAKPYEGG